MSSSRRARRLRRHARYGKPVYQSKPGRRPDRVLFDEAAGLMSIDPGAFAGQAGKTVPLSVGGVGGPLAGLATVVPDLSGLRVSMQVTRDAPWPLEAVVPGGMSFRPVFEEWSKEDDGER